MNQKGILFTAMAFILLSTLLALTITTLGNAESYDDAAVKIAVFRKVDDKYSNIENQVRSLTTSDAEKEIDKRILPFSYDINETSFSITAQMPLRANRVQSYLEALSAFGIFAQDTNYARHFDSLLVDVNTPLPISWGGADANISFLIMPQCMRYSLLDYNSLEFSQGCADYNYLSITRHDLNIMLSSVNDFNSLSCAFNGESACPENDFNSLSPLPYLSVNFDGSDCAACSLLQQTIKGHFDPSEQSTISLSCEGPTCISPTIDLNFSEGLAINYSGPEISLTYSFSTGTPIESMIFLDANISVEHRDFGAREWG